MRAAAAHVEAVRLQADEQNRWELRAVEKAVDCVASLQLAANLSAAGLDRVAALLSGCEPTATVWPMLATHPAQGGVPLIVLAKEDWKFDCAIEDGRQRPVLKLASQAAAGQQELVQRLELAGKLATLIDASKTSSHLGAVAWRLVGFARDIDWARTQLTGRCEGSRHAGEIMNSLTRLHLRKPSDLLAREFKACGGIANEAIDRARVIEALWSAPAPGSAETLREVFRTANQSTGSCCCQTDGSSWTRLACANWVCGTRRLASRRRSRALATRSWPDRWHYVGTAADSGSGQSWGVTSLRPSSPCAADVCHESSICSLFLSATAGERVDRIVQTCSP